MLERSFASLRLLSDTLTRAQLSDDKRLIWSTLTQAHLRAFRADGDDREGIIDQLFLTHGVDVAVLFIELADGSTKLSLRSHGHLDVAQFARSLTEHGGGHAKAAGANLSQPIREAIDSVLRELKAAMSGPSLAFPQARIDSKR